MTIFTHRFVEFIPETLEEKVLYVSLAYGTVSHRCACGCGREVVTPLTPTDWELTYDGETVSLHPSIGNWNFSCRSHYWIKNDCVRWAEDWSQSRIDRNYVQDIETKNRHHRKLPSTEEMQLIPSERRQNFWKRLQACWKRL